MTDRLRQAREIFEQAIEINDRDQRAVVIHDACRGDVGLQQAVDALLSAHDQANGILNDENDNGELANRKQNNPAELTPTQDATTAERAEIGRAHV